MKRYGHPILIMGLLGLALVSSACSLLEAPAPPKEPLDLTILHTGQVEGETLPCG
jgi:hypothetical protein